MRSPLSSPLSSPLRSPIGEAGAFSPMSITGLAAWYDPSDVTSLTFNSTRISAMADKSAGGNHMVNATANQQPLYVAGAINGLPVIHYGDDGTTRFLSCADNATMDYTEFAAFAVVQRKTDLGANENVFGKWKPTGNLREFRLICNSADNAAGQVTADGSTVRAANTPSTVSVDVTEIWDFSTTDTTHIRAARNHGTDGTQTMTSIFAGAAPLNIGAHGDGGERWAGYVGEVIWYTVGLSTAQRLQVLQYLANKWGVTLS